MPPVGFLRQIMTKTSPVNGAAVAAAATTSSVGGAGRNNRQAHRHHNNNHNHLHHSHPHHFRSVCVPCAGEGGSAVGPRPRAFSMSGGSGSSMKGPTRQQQQQVRRVSVSRGDYAALRALSEPRYILEMAQPGFYRGRMFSKQPELPRLPVPPLRQTMDRYLNSIRPLVDDSIYKTSEELVKEFVKPGGEGEQLQKLLEERAANLTNWLSDWWLHYAYLGNRMPVAIHSSPGMTFPLQDFEGIEGQLKHAAKLVRAVLDYKVLADKRELPVDTMAGDPLCMDQHYKILSSCRVPGAKEDEIVCFPPTENTIRHIVVMNNNQLFNLQVYGEDGEPLSERKLYELLLDIVHQSPERDDSSNAIGILTSMDRNTWANVYRKLSKSSHNRHVFRQIHKAVFVLCLDRSTHGFVAYNHRTKSSHQMLHGCGSKFNSSNRWFDKTIQFIVGKDGESGCCYEHAPAEGPPIAALMDHVINYVNNSSGEVRSSMTVGQLEKGEVLQQQRAQKLVFTLDPYTDLVHENVLTARDQIDQLITDMDMICFSYQKFGKDFAKKHGLSPDSFIQTGLQLAFYRMHGEVAATYESASTRRFQLGRTDTIRSCTVDSTAFCQAMDRPGLTVAAKASALKDAVKAHKNYVNQAIHGQAIDRHLLGLKLIAVDHGMNIPKLHMDLAYTISMHHNMSTSQVPCKFENLLAFGPTVEDGYGICYNPMGNNIIFGVTAYYRYEMTDTKKFRRSLEIAFDDMHDVLRGVEPPERKIVAKL